MVTQLYVSRWEGGGFFAGQEFAAFDTKFPSPTDPVYSRQYTSPETSGVSGLTIAPDGSIYMFPGVSGQIWRHCPADLSGPWENSSSVGESLSGCFDSAGTLWIMAGDSINRDLIKYPDPHGPIAVPVASWTSDSSSSDRPEQICSDGTNFYTVQSTNQLTAIKITPNGTITTAMDLTGTDYTEMGAPAAVNGRLYVLSGHTVGGVFRAVVLSCAVDSPTNVTEHASWLVSSAGMVISGSDGAGLIINGTYYFTGGISPTGIGRYKIGTATASLFTYWGGYLLLATALPTMPVLNGDQTNAYVSWG